MINHKLAATASLLPLIALVCASCQRAEVPTPPIQDPREEVVALTNRVDIPAPVRENLGITFVSVERRNVAHTLRVPGSFELLPTATREYRAHLGGRVELLVKQHERVEAGTPLFHVDSASWRELLEETVAMEARVVSMGPVREAHREHERSLADKVALWQDRLAQLEQLRAAGGGSAAQFTEARAMLNETQAELADVKEKEAELQAEQVLVESQLRSLRSRREMVARSAGCPVASDDHAGYTVCAIAPGVVDVIRVTQSGIADDNGYVLSVVQPDQVRFRAKGLQSDLGRLRDGLSVSVVPAQRMAAQSGDVMTAELRLGLIADPDERTIDLLAMPLSLAPWARAGVAAYLEVTLEGGRADLAIPMSAVARDGQIPIIFRRDPADPDKAIRLEADLGISDGRWVAIRSGVGEGDEIVDGGNYQLMLATSGTATKAGHFHSDGTFHDGED